MEEFDEMLKELNDAEIIQTSIGWEENIPEDLWNKWFLNYSTLDDDLESDRHRWYELTTSVIKINDRILGIRHITDLFSESSEVSDIQHILRFFEMEEFTTTSYRRK